jgi:hypothetical protein
LRVIAVEASKQALPRKYIESWRNDREDVMGVPSYVLSAGREGGLTGAAVGRDIIRKIGIFWTASINLSSRTASILG